MVGRDAGEKLSPAERAAYVLREGFDYSYREIANVLRLKEDNTRQLVTRARQRVAENQHAAVNSAEQQRFFTVVRLHLHAERQE
jgi:RNA polymerase sigma-70 factor (ECF subfamily)